MPDWVANKAARLERIRAAKAILEAEAKQPPPDDEDGAGPSSDESATARSMRPVRDDGRKGSRKAAMAMKLKRAGRRSRYRLRKQIVEPVFGQIMQARGFRQFLLRGLNKVRGEWAMICTVHNLLKLAEAIA
jgi:hypothetical protein